MGAWIEINSRYINHSEGEVAPLVGAWIEIFVNESIEEEGLSLLSWERGLKYINGADSNPKTSRFSRGSVD